MTSIRCSIPCQEINFTFNGEEMPTETFVKPEKDSFAALLTYLNGFLLLSVGVCWAYVGS